MKTILILAAAATAVFLLDRLLLFFEKKGYIYYRKTKGTGSTLGASALEMQSILQPEKKYIVEEKKKVKKEEREQGRGTGEKQQK